MHWLTTRDGPAPALADTPGVRARLPQVLGPAAGAENAVPQVAWITDADGDDAIEVAPADGGAPPRRFGGGQLGRVLELAASPDGSRLAVAAHDGRVLVADVAAGEVREVGPLRLRRRVRPGLVARLGLAGLVAPGRGEPAPDPRPPGRRRRRASPVEVTPLRFLDTSPVFTLDGLHLAFLSTRTLDPVYDDWVFDLSFPAAPGRTWCRSARPRRRRSTRSRPGGRPPTTARRRERRRQ